MSRLVLVLVAAALLVGPIAACGKKGALEPPPDAKQSQTKKNDKKQSE